MLLTFSSNVGKKLLYMGFLLTGLADGFSNDICERESFESLLTTRSPTLKSLSPSGYELAFPENQLSDEVDLDVDDFELDSTSKSSSKPKAVTVAALSLSDFTAHSLSSDISPSVTDVSSAMGCVFNACSRAESLTYPIPPVVLRIEVTCPNIPRVEIVSSSKLFPNPSLLPPPVKKRTKRVAGVKRRLPTYEETSPTLAKNSTYNIFISPLENIQQRPAAIPMLENPITKRSRRKLS